MKLLAKLLLVFCLVAVVFALLVVFVVRKRASASPEQFVTLALAPPAEEDSGPVPALPEPPAGAIVFDLKYRPETGAQDDLQYHSFWGFGGSDDPKDPFIQEARKRAKKLRVVDNFELPGRQRAGVECEGRKAVAFYFDLNADGKLTDNERILPTRKTGGTGVDFITPDFMLKGNDGREARFRVLLRAEFYGSNSEPNFMWSPACVLEGNATINGKPARMILFANGFSGAFERFGSASCAILLGESAKGTQNYIPRERLSRLVRCEAQFYQMKLEGRRSSGHPARAVLTKDTSPIGGLAIKLASSNSLQTAVSHLSFVGANSPDVYFNLPDLNDKLPVGAYRLENGTLRYGQKGPEEWQVTFSEGPAVTLVANEQTDVTLGEPTLAVRALDENKRYDRSAKGTTTFKKDARIFLEPKIVGKGNEVFTRFAHPGTQTSPNKSVPPKISITAADGKEVLAKTMEYG